MNPVSLQFPDPAKLLLSGGLLLYMPLSTLCVTFNSFIVLVPPEELSLEGLPLPSSLHPTVPYSPAAVPSMRDVSIAPACSFMHLSV